MPIPCYPDFTPLDIGLKDDLHPRLSMTPDGVSEFTFSILYLYRNKFKYRVSRNSPHESGDAGFIFSGEQTDHLTKKTFTYFMAPCNAPDWETVKSLLETHDKWISISESVLFPISEKLAENGINITEDRNNFDYLYYRSDLAELAGKKYHKKKNHINNFLHTYPDYEQHAMSKELIPAAIDILDRWRQGRSEDGDYKEAREALELFGSLPLQGMVFFAGGKPAAYCLGESISRGKMFAVHFEKAIDEYKGIYQFINHAFASSLPRFFTVINREQDMGNEGLRQAKMTYRPFGFVKKYTASVKI